MKPENAFIGRVHKLLPPHVYAEKTHNVYRGGTPDCFYEGRGEDLWIEYKWLPKLPVRENTRVILDLSELQKRWLKRRAAKLRPVWVVLGYKDGRKTRVWACADPITWEAGAAQKRVSAESIPIEDFAKLVTSVVN